VACPVCGQQYTLPEPAVDVEDEAPSETGAALCAAGVPLSATMMQDLPAVTQFDNHFGDSIIAMAAGGAAAVLAGQSSPQEPSANSAHETDDREAKSTVRLAGASTCNSAARPAGQPAELQPGARLLNRYSIHRKIGQGGMSTDHEAFHEERAEKVALKILLPQLAAKRNFQERFLQEGRISSNFSHPGIARVYDLHQTDSMVFLSMELLHGSTLRHDMNRRKDQRQSYRPLEVMEMLQHISEALDEVHAQKVVHRDLKPENLWLALDGSVKIMDFGIARDRTGIVHTQSGRGSGTPYFIAPE
jgi:tRNA A-37 threonylcarbamoyl transferase component Bud32